MAKHVLSLDTKLKDVLRAYRDSFSVKAYSEENEGVDPLMAVFGITAVQKRENRQYLGAGAGHVLAATGHECPFLPLQRVFASDQNRS